MPELAVISGVTLRIMRPSVNELLRKGNVVSEENKFKPGNSFGQGRRAGSRNKLQHKFLTALQEDFDKEGDKVIRIARIEKPIEYLKLIAGLMPKELLIT